MLTFPVFPRINNESTSKFVQTHSSPQKTPQKKRKRKKKKKTKTLSFFQLKVSFH